LKQYFFLLILIALVLGACANNKPKQEVELNGTVTSNAANIRVFGATNLQKGAVLQVVLKELNTNNSKTILEEVVTVGDGGKFSWTSKKPNRNEECELNVLFLPEKQPDKIQNVYGETGEFIKKESKGIISYNYEQKKYTGIKKYDLIVNNQNTILMESLPSDMK
jgi:hypothetical protein